METTINLYQKLLASSDDLRSQMDANEYKNYLLASNLYKYLSDKMLDELDQTNLSNIKEMYDEEIKDSDSELEGFMGILGSDL